MQKNQLFGIFLPDPTAPFYNPRAAFYVGTQEEIQQFIDRLEASPKASWYKDVIAAVRAYSDDPEIRYEIAGQKYPAMMPVTEIGRKEFSLSDHTWIHKVPHESVQHLMRAGYVWVSYIIVTSGIWSVTCCKVQFEDLSISTPGLGWISLGSASNGTPGLFYSEVSEDDETRLTCMSLYRSERWHSRDEKAPTVENLPGPMRADLSVVVGEFLGHC